MALLEALSSQDGDSGHDHKRLLLQKVQEKNGVLCNPGAGRCEVIECALRPDCESSAPPLEMMWERVIAYWSTLAMTPEIWNVVLAMDDEPEKLARERFIEALCNAFSDFSLGYSTEYGGKHCLAMMYRRLSLNFKRELKAAEAIGASGYRTNHGRVRSGVIMLKQLGLLSKMRQQVNERLEQTPSDPSLIRLKSALSSFSPALLLLQSGNPQGALEELDHLPNDVRESPQGQEIRGNAALLLGRQSISLGSALEALACWRAALGELSIPAIRHRLQKEIVDSCLVHAHRIENTDAAGAIAVLQAGYDIVNEPRLKLRLAELLAGKAIRDFGRTLDEVLANKSGDNVRLHLPALEQAKREMARASELGSRLAADNLVKAESWIADLQAQLGSGMLELPDEAMRLIREADRAQTTQNWDAATDCYRAAMAIIGADRAPQPVKRSCCVALSCRGVMKANRAIARLVAHRKKLDDFADKLRNNKKAWENVCCAACSGCLAVKVAWAGDWYTVTLGDGTIVSLCAECMAGLQKLEAQETQLNDSEKQDLLDARKDMREAIALDPGNETAGNNLKEINAIILQHKLMASPSSYGMQIKDNAYVLFVKKNDPYPTPSERRVSHSVRIGNQGQRIIELPIYGGNSFIPTGADTYASRGGNDLQGTLVAFLPPNVPAGALVQVKLWLNEDGVIEASARLSDGLELKPWIMKGKTDSQAFELLKRVQGEYKHTRGKLSKEERAAFEKDYEKMLAFMEAGQFAQALERLTAIINMLLERRRSSLQHRGDLPAEREHADAIVRSGPVKRRGGGDDVKGNALLKILHRIFRK